MEPKNRTKDTKGPKKISALFDVYRKRLKAPQASVVHALCEVVQDLLGITLEEQRVEHDPRTRITRLNIRGAQKSEILLHKEEILTHIKGRVGSQNAPTTLI